MSQPDSDAYPYPVARIGIIGGGQLGRMMVRAARSLGCTCVVLDPTPNSPAGQVAGHQIVGNYHDPAALRELAESCDVTTFDIEDIDTHTLIELSRAGRQIFPGPGLLADIQDKLRQKQVLTEAGIPNAEFAAADQPDRRPVPALRLPAGAEGPPRWLRRSRRAGDAGRRGLRAPSAGAVADRALYSGADGTGGDGGARAGRRDTLLPAGGDVRPPGREHPRHAARAGAHPRNGGRGRSPARDRNGAGAGRGRHLRRRDVPDQGRRATGERGRAAHPQLRPLHHRGLHDGPVRAATARHHRAAPRRRGSARAGGDDQPARRAGIRRPPDDPRAACGARHSRRLAASVRQGNHPRPSQDGPCHGARPRYRAGPREGGTGPRPDPHRGGGRGTA